VFGESPQAVSQHVWEMAGEVDVPLLRDVAVREKLDLNTAARYTKYDRSGNYGTWKAGLEWSVTDQLRVRGTRSRDIRAPTLYDLYAPQSQVVVRPTDLLTGASPAVPQIDQSNPDLKAEIGNTTTLGVVWKPIAQAELCRGRLPHEDLGCDHHGIRLDGGVPDRLLPERRQLALLRAAGASQRLHRHLGRERRHHLGQQERQHLERRDLWPGLRDQLLDALFGRPASLRFLTAWQPHVIYRQPGLTTVDQGGAAFGPGGMAATPSVRLSAYLRFRPVEDVTVDITERWRNAMKISGDPTEVWVEQPYPLVRHHRHQPGLQAWLGQGRRPAVFNVENLFDATPPIGAFEGNGTRAGLRDGFALGDDPRGRYYTVGIRSLF
jgi:iron complex outermembrane receptor protein